MKNENSIENGECVTTGNMLKKNEEKTSIGTIVRNPLNGRILQIVKRTTPEFILEANKIHNNKYNYSKFIYTGSDVKSIIICNTHGEFLQTPNCHLSQQQGCPKCGYERTHRNNTYTKNTWVLKAGVVHNNKYDYSKSIYVNSYTNLIIECPKHGEFQQTPDAHLQGRGCPKCKTSKGEDAIKEWLEAHDIPYAFQKTFDDCRNPETGWKLKYDFYVPSRNLLIEFDGIQHFKVIENGKFPNPVERVEYTQRLDKLKTDYAKSREIGLVRIPYTEFNKIEEKLLTAFQLNYGSHSTCS